jgi:polyisoprenoid-binding protein YceI
MADIAGNFRLGPDSGHVVLKTTRAGLAAKVGHDLTIEITRWSADITVPDDGDLSAATVAAELDLGSLTVRQGTGGARPLSDSDRRDIQSTIGKILGGGGSSGGGPATATFRSSRVIAAPGGSTGAIEGMLTLNGRSRHARVQVSTPEAGHYRGGLSVVQSEFGIKPYTGFFGALKLRDEVAVELEITVTKAQPS